jgi:hypothetical protein
LQSSSDIDGVIKSKRKKRVTQSASMGDRKNAEFETLKGKRWLGRSKPR